MSEGRVRSKNLKSRNGIKLLKQGCISELKHRSWKNPVAPEANAFLNC